MQLLASSAGEIQPIDPVLGREAHDWVLRPKRNEVAFAYYARRALRETRNADCLAQQG
ncbi:class II aldolase/adducin domain protein [compost metagenome]